MRRLVLTAAVLTSSLTGGFIALAPAAHAAAGACLNAHVNVNGQDVVNQQQCLPPQ